MSELTSQSGAPAIGVKDAVRIAKINLQELFEDDPVRALALEEIELVEQSDRRLWAVTLGFHQKRSVSVQSTGLNFLQPPPQVENRVYKTVFIDAATGEFVKMDMRIV